MRAVPARRTLPEIHLMRQPPGCRIFFAPMENGGAARAFCRKAPAQGRKRLCAGGFFIYGKAAAHFNALMASRHALQMLRPA